MNPVTRTHNAYHLGDNLVHMHFLRKVARANPDRTFVHFPQWQYMPQLRAMIQDVPNIALSDFNHHLPADSINAWRGARQFWYQHPDRNDFVKFHIESWFPDLAERMKVENPIKLRSDMLFDYPAIQDGNHNNLESRKPGNSEDSPSGTAGSWPPDSSSPNSILQNMFDVLVINSAPGSGQFRGYDEYLLGNLAIDLAKKGHGVITTADLKALGSNIPCTNDAGLDVTAIGHISLHCHTILMVSTGPSWPTFNIWNQESVKRRIILLDSERVNLSPNTIHCETMSDAADELKKAGLL